MSPTREEWFRAKEVENTSWLDRDHYQVIRVDGRAFHTFTRQQKFEKPMDKWFMGTMDLTAQTLCEEIQGAVFAYVQSDEISILVGPCANLKGQMWFGGQLRKWLSVGAGIASSVMSREWEARAVFDSRVLSLEARTDAIRYFLWRQSDCIRNAIQATAQHKVGHKKILGKDRVLQLRALEAAGVDYGALPQGWRNGRVIVPVQEMGTVTYTRKDTGEVQTTEVERNVWKIQDAPAFDWDEAGFLEATIK
jgi:tRNA(His) 5'-end guanylyltransferase